MKLFHASMFASLLRRLDELSFEVATAMKLNELMGETHPDSAVRAAGKECRPEATALQTGLYLDRRLPSRVESLGGQEGAAHGYAQTFARRHVA